MVAIVSAMSEFEFFISSTCFFYLFTLFHMEMLRYFPVGGNIGHSYEKVEELYLLALNMELTILTQFQVVCTRTLSSIQSHLSSATCSCKKCLTEVIGTILMLEWVLC